MSFDANKEVGLAAVLNNVRPLAMAMLGLDEEGTRAFEERVLPGLAATIHGGRGSVVEGFERAAAEINLRWATERLKVVEDQRAADVARIFHLESLVSHLNDTIADRDTTIRRLRADLARAGLALDEAAKEVVSLRAKLDGLNDWHVKSVRENEKNLDEITRMMGGGKR